MKYTKFSSLPGETSADKLQHIFDKAFELSGSDCIITQPKFNGVHLKIRNGRVLSRDNHLYNPAVLPVYLTPYINLSKRNNNWTIHGEAFSTLHPFEVYTGALSVNRVEKSPLADAGQFEAFDLDIGEPADYEARMNRLHEEIDTAHASNLDYAYTVEEAEADYNNALLQGFEGVVYRISPCYYADDDNPHPCIIKRKQLREVEGVCIGAAEGVGKRAGKLGCLYVCLPNKQTVAVGGGPGMTDEVLEKLWKNPPYGARITITYEDTAENGMPLRPQFKAIRNYE